MAADQVRITLRIPRDVHAAAVALAKQTDRSLNWQMVNLMKIGLANSEAQQEAHAEEENEVESGKMK